MDKENIENQENTTKKEQYTVAIVSDGSDGGSLGDVGPVDILPILEEKAEIYNIDDSLNTVALPVETNNLANFAKTITNISIGFDCIVLEDIALDKSIELRDYLDTVLDIPVINPSVQAVPIMILGGIRSALRFIGKKRDEIKVVINGTNKLTQELVRLLISLGIKNILILHNGEILSPIDEDLDMDMKILAGTTNSELISGDIINAITNSDVFINLNKDTEFVNEYLEIMNEFPIVINLTNSKDENLDVYREDIVYMSKSDNSPNIIDTDFLGPAIVKALILSKSKIINTEMVLDTAKYIGDSISSEELSVDNLFPSKLNVEDYENLTNLLINSAKRSGASHLGS